MSEQIDIYSTHEPRVDFRAEPIAPAAVAYLIGSVIRHNYFADDEGDEFKIHREDGSDQGIFKVWSPHVLPQLDSGYYSGGQEVADIWAAELAPKPLSLHESLEQWRSYAATADRRLQTIFAQRPIPIEPEAAITEQLLRLNVAFGYAAPFYDIEALIVDPREVKSGNPIDFEAKCTNGGRLDVAAMLLPAALGDRVTADIGDWHDTSWHTLSETTEQLREKFLSDPDSEDAEQYGILLEIAGLADITPDEVLFAANALQHIPSNVGGKREDLPQAEAIRILKKVLTEAPGIISTNLIAKDTNALIRFKNWCPAIKSPDNFKNQQWSYGAVCETSDKLLSLVSDNPQIAYGPDFGATFRNQLSPQLQDLDASSARGRFQLQLFSEGRFSEAIMRGVSGNADAFNAAIYAEMRQLAKAEEILAIGASAPAALIGGKAQGLGRAMQLFGPEKVLGGSVITSEAIACWLEQVPAIYALLWQLENTPNMDDKLLYGERIVEQLENHPVPTDLISKIVWAAKDMERIVLRSSSYDEDVALIGPAPGVYESVVDIDPTDDAAIAQALKTVVGSFFSDKAISFRELKGLRHKPLFAVPIQEYMEGAGGSVFIQDGIISLNIAGRTHLVNTTGRLHAVESYRLDGTETEAIQSAFLPAAQVAEIIDIARSSERAFGSSDIEFVIDDNNRLRLLQLRSLERPSANQEVHDENRIITDILLDDADTMPETITEGALNLIVSEHINLERFQGSLFRWIISNNSHIASITLQHTIPETCHFANIIQSLGIQLKFQN